MSSLSPSPLAAAWLPAAALPTQLHNPPHHLVLQLPPCHESSLPRLPVSAPPTGLDECFFFIFLVVGLPNSSISCQLWLFFVFKLLLSFFWLCEEAQCVYLHLHLGRSLHIVLFSIPFFSVPVVWNLRNVIHNLGMYMFLHAVKETPFETTDQGKARQAPHSLGTT